MQSRAGVCAKSRKLKEWWITFDLQIVQLTANQSIRLVRRLYPMHICKRARFSENRIEWHYLGIMSGACGDLIIVIPPQIYLDADTLQIKNSRNWGNNDWYVPIVVSMTGCSFASDLPPQLRNTEYVQPRYINSLYSSWHWTCLSKRFDNLVQGKISTRSCFEYRSEVWRWSRAFEDVSNGGGIIAQCDWIVSVICTSIRSIRCCDDAVTKRRIHCIRDVPASVAFRDLINMDHEDRRVHIKKRNVKLSLDANCHPR